MKKFLIVLSLMLVMVLSFSLISCNGDNDKDKLSVTFYDGDTVLKTVKVESGKTVESYLPTKAGGYEFVNWFSTPSKNHKFDFNKPITEKTDIFAGFTLFAEDTRNFYIVGSGTSELLFGQDWGKNITDVHKLTKDNDKNEYSITTDLIDGDEFQFAINNSWHNKRGYGYLLNNKLSDGTIVFDGAGGGLGEVTSKGMNIKVKHSGNYTLTLKTYPNEDYYNTSDTSYTEAQKEVYNYGTYDVIEWVRNGEALNPPQNIIDYYIKGANITGWQDLWNNDTKFANTEGVYTLTVYLKENEEFVFTSTNTINTSISVGTDFLRYDKLDETSQDLFTNTPSNNFIASDTATYTFSYNSSTQVLTASKSEDIPAKRDYYIDGTFIGSWGDSLYGVQDDRQPGEQEGSYLFISDYKLTETSAGSGVYQLLGVTLPAECELIIQSYKQGATEPGKWGTEGYNLLGTYNSTYLLNKLEETDNFKAVGGSNKNIYVKTAGTYNIIFNSYSKVISISDGYDIYIKGDMNSWVHGYDEDYKFVQSDEDDTKYELTLTFAEGQGFGFALYNKGASDPNDLGIFLNKQKGGDAADTSKFVPDSGTNFKASVAGTYKIVYDVTLDKINFYAVT